MRSQVHWLQCAIPVSEGQIRLTGRRGTYAAAIALTRRKLAKKAVHEAKDRKDVATGFASALQVLPERSVLADERALLVGGARVLLVVLT